MPNTAEQKNRLPFLGFVHCLREYGLPISLRYLVDFYGGLKREVVTSIDDLFLFCRLVFVKKVEHFDIYERAFAHYFYGIDIPAVSEGDYALFQTPEFQKWLQEAIDKGEVPPHRWDMNPEELMKKFWERLREQMKEHHGGDKWIGTGGTSPFGHSGNAQRGARVGGQSGNRSALKVIGGRRYVDYTTNNTLRDDNIRQAFAALKNIRRSGLEDELDITETIRKSALAGGEIELSFRKREKNKINLYIFLDNGGYSMDAFIDTTRRLFTKVKDQYKDCKALYFHNTIYEHVYTDARRTKPFPMLRLLEKPKDSILIFVGDASMAPEELMYSYGNINWGSETAIPSIEWLQKLADRFKKVVWLNPIPKQKWHRIYGSWTIQKIADVFHMEDLTIGGIKSAVEYINNQVVDHA